MASRVALSKALRVIGQILEQRGIDLFDLRHIDNAYTLQCGDPAPPHLKLVVMRYSSAEIDALDLKARAHRQGSYKFVNFEGLPEILRALGRQIDDRNGRLLRITNSEPSKLFNSIKIEYQSRDGQRHAEEILAGAVGDQAMRMYKERSRRFDGNMGDKRFQ